MSNHYPDVLTTLSNLSSDEVFTSPKLANEILDTLPKSLFKSSQTKFLDPCSKSGVFLKEITQRLIEGLEKEFPVLEDRIEHIFQNQVFGIAITELTALMSRRTLYCSSKADSEYSIAQSFENSSGNIVYNVIEHTWKSGKCIHCGLSQNAYSREEESEKHAYEFIHPTSQNIFENMKFDVIIGNPPYQASTGGRGGQAVPIYHKFIAAARALKPRYISMIIPSRWFASNFNGLGEFRKSMTEDEKLKYLVDFPDATDCFPPPVEIKSGVCYFLIDSTHKGPCDVITKIGDMEEGPIQRNLNEYDIIIRRNQSLTILDKVLSKKDKKMSDIVSNIQPFGLKTNFENFKEKEFPGSCKLYARNKTAWVSKAIIPQNTHLIDKYKVLISEGYNGGDQYPHKIIGTPIVTSNNSCCTMTYIVCGAFDTKKEAKNLEAFLKTKFCRFLIHLRKNTQHVNKDRFAFVPLPSLSKPLTDNDLYKQYEINNEEIKFIDSIVKELE